MSQKSLLAAAVLLLGLSAVVPVHTATRAPMAGSTVFREHLPRLSAGGEHTCHVPNDGVVRCWGRNADHQMGDVTTIDRLVPVFAKATATASSKLTSMVATTAGLTHSCALRVFGQVLCWGSNAFGQLGTGGFVDADRAQEVANISTAVRISAGASHTCALLADGTVLCWGKNTSGQLGNNSTTNSPAPVTVAGLTAIDIAAGGDHTCALLADGTARCWGENSEGQVGDNSTTNRLTPVAVFGLTGAKALDTGLAHSCVVRVNGQLSCWGRGAKGSSGTGGPAIDFNRSR